jgi:hypothetical protein
MEAKAGEQNGARGLLPLNRTYLRSKESRDVSFQSGVVAVRNAARSQHLFAVSGGY